MVNKINFFYASHNNGIPSTIFTVDDYPKEPIMNTVFKVKSNLLLDSEPDNYSIQVTLLKDETKRNLIPEQAFPDERITMETGQRNLTALGLSFDINVPVIHKKEFFTLTLTLRKNGKIVDTAETSLFFI
ncbi:hypothetical protein [Lactococcus lactis]|uniref:hypothetical protein n=1 Tax=Lactococcus lactis TaxID=1358 RepID=UPI0022E1195E|nr:hypothetical protein [Lactococcus lactis]WKG34652.1 hypothetical protein QZH48_10035 [Lactococcus lactis subsp. lactis]